MNIAITGAAGRVGRGVVELALSQGHSVVALDRAAISAPLEVDRFIEIDMRDYDAVIRGDRWM